MSVEKMEKYYEDDNFLYLVVEVIDLYFGFDLTTDWDYEIAAKIVTQSYSVNGINGKNRDGKKLDSWVWVQDFIFVLESEELEFRFLIFVVSQESLSLDLKKTSWVRKVWVWI